MVLSQRLLPVLQLTRMALVFTAVADGWCALLLWAAREVGEGKGLGAYLAYLGVEAVVAAGVVSVGLYGFGMSLNDIIDRRRDVQIAAHRPLPSGRIGVVTAHAVCVGMALLALAAGFYYAAVEPGLGMSLVLVVWTGMLIAFYDLAGKYLVWPGLITLGLVRLFHAVIAVPMLPLLWHPLLLLNHVAILSALAYVWEEKRPALTRAHVWAFAGALGVINAMAIGLVWWRRVPREGGFVEALWVEPGLALPGLAAVAFAAVAWAVRRRSPGAREAGQKVMLYGLLWLIVYDASFALGYVGWRAAVAVAMLLPVAWLSVRLMRWWGNVLSLSKRPEFRRA